MDRLLQQLISVLSIGAGNLAYHLVVSFSIVAALTVTLYGWRKDLTREYRRLAFGLGMLIVLRLLLFTAAGLAWQGVVSTSAVLPWLERGVDALSLLLIVWLWVFPAPARLADLATITLGLVLLGLVALGISGLKGFGNDQSWLVDSYLIQSWLVGLVLSILGIVLLAVRKPPAWIAGLFALGVIGISILAARYFVGATGQSGLIRLAQMIAYPFLIVLPLRLSPFPLGTIEKAQTTPPSPTDLSNEFLQGLLIRLLALDSPAEVGKVFSAEIAQWMQADFCLVALPINSDGLRYIPYGYDLVHRIHLTGLSASGQEMPVLESAFRQGRHLCLPGNSTAPDLKTLAKTLDLKRSGSVMALSYFSNDQIPSLQLILLNPFSGRKWTSEHLGQLLPVFQPLAHILQQSIQNESFELERQRLQEEYENVQIRLQKTESDRVRLMELVAILQTKSWTDLPGGPNPPQRTKAQEVTSSVPNQGSVNRPGSRAGSQPESGRLNKSAEQKTARSASIAEDGKRE